MIYLRQSIVHEVAYLTAASITPSHQDAEREAPQFNVRSCRELKLLQVHAMQDAKSPVNSHSPEWIEREELLRSLDTTQCVTADRDKLATCQSKGVCESLREQHVAFHRSAQRGDAGNLVDSWTDYREVEPFIAANVAVKYRTDMKAHVDICDR